MGLIKQRVVLDMFRSGRFATRKHCYYVESKESLTYIQEATEAFKSFSQNPRDYSAKMHIKKASELYLKAIDASTLNTDKAYCSRKYASTIIRDESLPIEERYYLALNYLQDSISKYEHFVDKNPHLKTSKIFIMELQRAYVLLGHVALKLKSGAVLSNVTEKLNHLLERLPNQEFMLEVLTYQWHLNLSQNKISVAKENITDSMKHSECHSISNPTDYRHLAKINLLEVSSISDSEAKKTYFEKHVMAHLWKSFDAHKTYVKGVSSQARDKALLKDIFILLYAKIVQRINGITDINPDETVYSYMVRQVSRLYKSRPAQVAFVSGALKRAIAQMKNTGAITLAYKLFDNSVPSISLSAEQFNQLFPDFEAFTKAQEAVEIAAPVAYHPGLFDSGNFRPEREACRAASSSPVI